MQWTSRLRRPAAGTVLGGLALVVAVTGGGYAVAQSQPQVVFACQSNKMLFLADPATTQCPAGQQRVELTTTDYTGFAGAAEHEALVERVAVLEAKLSKVSYDETGLNNLPTLKIDGANLQIVDGSAGTDGLVNGLGNLFIGYNEQFGETQTGSHNLVIGRFHTFTSWGGLLAGENNSLMHRSASVSGGLVNTASGRGSSVSGGYFHTASGDASSVSGGEGNTASGAYSSVSGGRYNAAQAWWSSILGGKAITVNTNDATSP